MPGISVKNLDSAGAPLIGGQNTTWKVDGQPIQLLGDAVTPHVPPGPHLSGPKMVEGSGWFKLNGIPVVRAGNKASCGHAATGRPWFNIE